MPEKIIKNRAYCKKCHEEISSATVHHFNTCRCGALSVDGGTEYLRRVGDPSNYVDTSIVIDVPEKRCPNVLDIDTPGAQVLERCRLPFKHRGDHYFDGEDKLITVKDANRKRLPKVRSRSI